MFFKKVLLKISQISQENTCVGVSFFNKVADLRLQIDASINASTLKLAHHKNSCCKILILITLYSLDTGRLLNVLCTFNLRPVSRGIVQFMK